jgi:ankyrin repeat protein
LHRAAMNANYVEDDTIFRALDEYGCDWKKIDSDRNSALHQYTYCNSISTTVLKYLLQRCHDINQTNRTGRTALGYLMMSSNFEIKYLEMFIHYGAQINKDDPFTLICKNKKVYTCAFFDVMCVLSSNGFKFNKNHLALI